MSTTVEEIEKTEKGEDKKNELLLDSLEIKGYRCFEHLTIEKLGRVNLIVGKNNVGKTALLEAISIYINKGNIQQLLNLLESRDEVHRGINQSNNKMVLVNYSFKNIFTLANNYTDFNPNTLSMKGNLSGETGTLTISLPKLRSKDGKPTNIANKLSKDSKMFSQDEGSVIEVKYTREKSPEIDLEYYIPLEDKLFVERKLFVRFSNVFIKLESLRNNQLLVLWDETNKNNLEEYVINAMQLLESNITDVSFIGVPSGSNNLIPHVVVSNNPVKLPLKRFGEGMTRILGLSLGLSNCRNGILLIDEIESGLHYSVLLDIWRMILKTAKDLNVQVFVTTHSSDCVKAFQRAAEEDKEDEGMLIRLVRKGDKIKAVLFDEEDLETVVENNIEVR